MYCFKLYFYNASGAPLGQFFPFLKVFNQRIFTVYCSLFCLKYTIFFYQSFCQVNRSQDCRLHNKRFGALQHSKTAAFRFQLSTRNISLFVLSACIVLLDISIQATAVYLFSQRMFSDPKSVFGTYYNNMRARQLFFPHQIYCKKIHK